MFGYGPATIGSSDGAIQQRSAGDIANAGRKRAPNGAYCLTIGAEGRPHLTNPKLFEHVIIVKSQCGGLINIQVCYYMSTNCVVADIPGYSRKEVILGIFPGLKDFRFAYREKT